MRSGGPALLPVFRSQHQAELLMWLMLHPDQEFGVSDLATRLSVPLSTLHREVVRLDEAGLLTSRTLGRNRLMRANTNHPAARALTQLLEVTFGPKAVVAEEFAISGATARSAVERDPDSAFVLAYDAARQALTGLLAHGHRLARPVYRWRSAARERGSDGADPTPPEFRPSGRRR